jgi:hypothetical protein
MYILTYYNSIIVSRVDTQACPGYDIPAVAFVTKYDVFIEGLIY